jgi:hypothetical protein
MAGRWYQTSGKSGNFWRATLMGTVYDIVTVACFACVVATYFLFAEGGSKVLAHFMLPAAAFAIANQVGNAGLRMDNAYMNVLAVVLIAAGIGYTFIAVRR